VDGGLSPYTIHGYVRALKAFSTWLHDERFSKKNLFSRLKRPKVPAPVIEILSDQEIADIIAAINPDCVLGARLYVIVLVLLDTGIRAGELVGLTLENTFVDDDYLKVMGKGQKERIVPFGATTKKALLRYIHTFRPSPLHDGIDQLILSTDGTPLTYSGLAQSVKRLGKKVGVPRLHAHLFRHTFAVRYLMNGGDIMTLRLILGHADLTVTQQYMHLAQAHVQIQHHRFSPVDRLGIKVRRRSIR
jgi:integrase/recombinase XerC/integrase/recombinase XerD